MPNNSRDAPQLGILLLQTTTHTAMLRYRVRNGISLWIGNVDAATNNDDNKIRSTTMTPIGDMMGTGLIEAVVGDGKRSGVYKSRHDKKTAGDSGCRIW